MKKWTGILAMCGLVLTLSHTPLLAIEAADHDAFFLSAGMANVEVNDSPALLTGANYGGGLRLGLFSVFFMELGYGGMAFSNTVDQLGTPTRVYFRTTGGFLGGGMALQIRAVHLGVRYDAYINNRWQQRRVDDTTGIEIDNISDRIDFNSYSVFTRFGKGAFEVGARRDRILKNTSQVDNAFGVYVALNLLTGTG